MSKTAFCRTCRYFTQTPYQSAKRAFDGYCEHPDGYARAVDVEFGCILHQASVSVPVSEHSKPEEILRVTDQPQLRASESDQRGDDRG